MLSHSPSFHYFLSFHRLSWAKKGCFKQGGSIRRPGGDWRGCEEVEEMMMNIEMKQEEEEEDFSTRRHR